MVACAAEALPQRFGTAFLHRADRLPFGLEAFDFADGGVPVCRLAERFDFRAERVLLCQVLRPPRFAFGEVGVTTREEAIAGGAEALPDRFLLPTGDRADPLPFRLQLLDLVGGLDPARRPGERFGALAQGDFLREVFGARFSLRREMRFAALPRLVVRRLEPAPQRLALRARHVGGLTPLLLQLSHLLRDHLRIVEGRDRFHLFAELLLDADVRPALPVGDVAQLLDLRYERGLRGLQPADGFLVVTLGRERRNPAKRRAEILERAFAGLERQIGTCGNRLDAAAQLLQPDQGLAARPLILLAGRGVAGRERRVGLGVARKDVGIAGRPGGHALPFAADNVELAACHRQILECRGPRRLVGELREPLAPALRLLPGRVAPLAGLRRQIEAARQLGLSRAVVERRHAFPFGAGDLEVLERGGAVKLVDPFADRDACPCQRVARRAGLPLDCGALGLFTRPRRATLGVLALRALDFGGIGFGRLRRRRGGRGGRRFGGCGLRGQGIPGRRRGALVSLAHDRPRALGRALVLCARGDLLELVPVGDPINRRERRVLEFAVQGDAEDLRLILECVEGRPPHGFVVAVPRDRTEGMALGHPRHRALRARFARCALRDAHQRLHVSQRVDRGQALRFADAFERLERDVAEHANRLHPHALVDIVACDRGQHGRIHQLAHGRAPHTRIGILAGDFDQQIALVERSLLHEGEPNGGVGMLVTRLSAESIKQCHYALQPGAAGLCPGSRSSVQRSTPVRFNSANPERGVGERLRKPPTPQAGQPDPLNDRFDHPIPRARNRARGSPVFSSKDDAC